MHHAPAGPPRSALAPLRTLIRVLRRARVLPIVLGAFFLGAFAMAAPVPDDADARDTAVLTSRDDGKDLVPATGDGWTQDGAPAETPPADEESSSSSASSPSSASVPSSSEPSSTPAETTGSSAGTSTESSTGTSSPSSAAAGSPSSSSSSRAPSSGSDESASPAGTPSAPTETEAPAADPGDPGDSVLAAVNDARTEAGCAALTADTGLASLATEHSAAMRDGDFVAVRSPDGGSPLDRGDRAAVVATGSDPDEVADDLLDEETLLDCDLSSAGVGTTGGYWTLLAA